MYFLFTLNYFLALGGLGLATLTIVLYWDYFYNQSTLYRLFIEKFVWWLLSLTTIGSVVLSLVYSEYFGFVPCSLCWLQRIALYPQALMVLFAIRVKDNTHFPLYGIALSAFGFVTAVYHYIYQMLPKESATGDFVLPCLADGSADCGTLVIQEFGFVTFPWLSAVTFAFLIALYLHSKKS